MKGKLQGMSRNKLKSALVPYGFITPATLTIVLLVLYPIMYGIYISFFDTNLVNKWNFVGFKYYIQALTDSSFLHSLWKTLVFTVTVVGGHFVLGFIFASFLNMDIRCAPFEGDPDTALAVPGLSGRRGCLLRCRGRVY